MSKYLIYSISAAFFIAVASAYNNEPWMTWPPPSQDTYPEQTEAQSECSYVSLTNIYRQTVGLGVLINPSYVLTAATKVQNYVATPQELTANVGDCWSAGQQTRVEKIELHEAFYPAEFRNNIALVKLGQPIKKIKVAKLAPFSPTPASSCYSPSKYRSASTGNNYDPAYMKVMSRSACLAALSNTHQRSDPRYQFLCAKPVYSEGVGVGDGGSPLRCHSGDYEWYVAGILSNRNNYYNGDIAVYTNVNPYKDWIDRVIKTNGNYNSGSTAYGAMPNFNLPSQ